MALYSTAGLPDDGKRVATELQGMRLSVVAGAAIGTKMTVPGMDAEDTILSATDATGSFADDAANCTTASTKATGTLTVAAAADGDTCVVNDVTYTFKTTPTAATHAKVTVGDNTAMALSLANTINAYENRRLSSGNNNTPAVVATAALAVVTINAVSGGTGSGPVVAEAGNEITLVATNPGAITATCVVAINNTTTLTVNGIVFSAKTPVTDLDLHFAVKADANTQAAEINRVINAYQNKKGTLNANATVAAAVVTIRSASGKTGNSVTLTGTAVRLVASGSGYLAGGSASGGFTSLTNLTGKSVILLWCMKNP